MIYGVEASETLANASPSLPSALGTADFVNGIYEFNGLPTDISDFIEDSTGLIDADGINFVADEPLVNITGALKDKLITFDWTIVFELNIDASPSGNEQVIFNLYSETPVYGYSNQVWAEVWGEWDFTDSNPDVGEVPGSGTPMERDCVDEVALTDGIHKVAMTRTNDGISMSIDGNPVQTVTSPGPFPINWDGGSNQYAVFGGWAYDTITNHFHMRSIAIYDSVNDATLRNLSA